jgi:hypothetical protein
LRDLILARPAVRDACLEILFEFCSYPDKTTRANAIVTAKKFYLEHSSVGPLVQNHAFKLLEELMTLPDTTQMDTSEAPESSEAFIISHLELYFSICSKNHSLLDR